MIMPLAGFTIESDEYGPLAMLSTPFLPSTSDGVWFCKHPNRLMRIRKSREIVEKNIGKFTLIVRATPTMNFHFPLPKYTDSYLRKKLGQRQIKSDETLFNILRDPIFDGLHYILIRCPKCIDNRVFALIRSLS